MYKKEFDNIITNNNLTHNSYMFWGENDYFIEHYASLVAKILSTDEDINKIYFDEYDFDNCLDILSSSSLFSNTNIVLLKIDKKIPKKDLDRLVNGCKLNSSSKLIIACLGDIDFKSMTKSFTSKSNSLDIRMFNPNDGEAIGLLIQKANKFTLQIDSNSLMFLYNMHQKDLALCMNDLDKLSILDEQITSKTINYHCFGLGNVNIDDFLIKLFTKQNINKDLYLLLEEGFNEIQLLTRITSYAQQLFMITTYIKLNGTLNIKEIWGYPLPLHIANKQKEIAIKFNVKEYQYMLNYLQNLELELKITKPIDINGYFQSKIRVLFYK